MKKAVSIVLAGALAASAMAATTTSASAHKVRHHHHHKHYDPGPAIAAGVIGLAIGALATSAHRAPAPLGPPLYYHPPAPAPIYPGYHAPLPAHTQQSAWCAAQYDTYDFATNTWVDFQGIRRPCFAPGH